MNNISLNLITEGWTTATQEVASTTLKGQTYLDQTPIDVQMLHGQLRHCESADKLAALLPRLNGFYAWVEQTGGQIRAAVDHVRSRPLFYGLKQGQFYLSDDAEWVRQQVGDQEMDPIAREEFLLAGYVTGQDTLFAHVKQLQAGEFLVAKQTSTGVEVHTQRYYRFLHQEPAEINESALRAQLDHVTVQAMQRLIDYANGRQIVIPLSGGYDSRLIASMLKRLGCTNVLCFTYGVPGNKEAEYSRKVAAALGFRWHFVEYTENLWREAWATAEADEYRKLASNHVSLPHFQDWLAVKLMVEEGVIESDAVVAPGHSGDFVAGSHIPDIVFTKDEFSDCELLDEISKNHLSNSPKKNMALENNTILRDRLENRISKKYNKTAIEFANLYELWDWQERQAKFIINSLRVYEHKKIQWWIPLWDLEFVKFWERVPLSLRRTRHWYMAWVGEIYKSQLICNDKKNEISNASDQGFVIKILKKIAIMLPENIYFSIKKLYKIFTKKHFLGFEGLIPKNSYEKYLKENYTLIGIYSELYISGEWGRPS
jgi:asparagine synthase (glutamine-hydrolysing)